MNRAEARDVTRASVAAARGIAGVVQTTHDATVEVVYGRLRRIIGPAVAPVHDIQRLVGRLSFGGVQMGLRGVGAAAEVIVPHAVSRADRRASADVPPDPPARPGPLIADGPDHADHADKASGAHRPLDEDSSDSLLQQRNSGFALGVLNGVAGDRLERDASSLALPTTLRQHGRDVPLTTEALRAAYGMGRSRLVVFVHGLVETELSWRFRARQRWGDPQVSYGSLLERDGGWLALYVRYNSGAPIDTNARRFADLLDGLVRAWPEPVAELVIVGHSMGGLVATTALAHDDRPWTQAVRAVVSLGSPRDGAPLERAAAVIEELTERTGWARWFGGLIGVRSGGIRDLHDPVTHPPLPDRIDEYAVLATLTPASWHPVVPRVGDGLVPVPEVHHCETVVVHGLHHLDLLNHPEVYAVLRRWLAPPLT